MYKHVFTLNNGQTLSIISDRYGVRYIHRFSCGTEQEISADKFCAMLDYATRKGWYTPKEV